MVKNPTPRQIAIWAALLIAGAAVVLALLFRPLEGEEGSWVRVGLFGLGLFAGGYFIIAHFLERYIYRKVKVIYKSIHKHKLSPAEKQQRVDLGRNIMEEVEKEVTEWAANQAREIESLKQWQAYRRKFIGDISHELKTPIFNIQGYLETLLDSPLDPEQQRRFLQRAAVNVERLITIIEDLNAISRLESGELMLELRPFDLKELTCEVFEDLEMKAARRNITLGFKAGADQPFQVRADRESIRQVLTNLVSNSIKYGNEGGHTKVGFYDMDRHVLVEVADNGIGIPPEHVNHVFDRFYRVDKSRSRAQGGSGLGLSIVKHILEAHQQTIHVRSSVGFGSTFGFTLEKA